MTTGRHTQVFQQLRQALLAHDGAGLTDAALLSCFVAQRDAAALEALIRRHASMVWSVCRRVLSNEQDAEDAFQASFLVFVRKAASLPARSHVGNWLYGVAYRTALKARTTDARRRAKERRAAEMVQPQAEADYDWSDLLPLLDQELSRLPDKYRTAIVLCELEGRPRKEAARQLGIPEGTLSSRLATARRMLAKRLGRPGLVLSAGAIAASTAVGPTLLASTVKAATAVAAGQAVVAGVVSVRVAALAEGVIKAMFLTRISAGVVLLTVVAVLAAGTGTAVYSEQAAQPDPKPPTPPVAAVQHHENNAHKEEVKKEEPEWGEAVDGIQARLRPAGAQWRLGAGEPQFALDMRNHGKQSHTAHRDSHHCEIELDGKWYIDGELIALYYMISQPIEAGQDIDDWVIISLAEGRPWVRKTPGRKVGDPPSDKDEVLQIAAGKHTLRVAFVFEDGVRPISQPMEIEAGAKESAWGEAVDGVQARIHTPAVWKAGAATFILDLRNQGKTTPNARRSPFDCQIEVDKVWYSFELPSGPYPAVGQPLEPGAQVNDWTTVTPDKYWVSQTPAKTHFRLPPGKHTIRIAYELQGTKPPIAPISGPLEIEISDKPSMEVLTDGAKTPPTKEAAPAVNANLKQTAAQRAVDLWNKLDERVNNQGPAIDPTLEKSLEALFDKSKIFWTASPSARGLMDKNLAVFDMPTIAMVYELRNVSWRQVLELLLSKYPSESEDDRLTYIIRPNGVEITTRRAFLDEFYPGRKDSNLPPLVYTVFDKVPLSEALMKLAQPTGSNVVLAGYLGKETETKVTANLTAVPLDAAVTLLADMADLKSVRVGNVYYVTTPERARQLQAEQEKRPSKKRKDKAEALPDKPAAKE